MRTKTTRSLILRTMLVALLAAMGANAAAQSSPQSCCGSYPETNGLPNPQGCATLYNYCMCDCGYWTSTPTGCGPGDVGTCTSACSSFIQSYGC